MRIPLRACALALVAAAALAGCTSTRIASVYEASGPTGGPFDRLMIVGLAPSEGARVDYETTFVAKLAKDGVTGIASVSVFPSRSDLTRATVEAWVRERGIRGVLVTRLADVKHTQRYVPPTPSMDLYGYYGYWGPSYMEPGYVVEETTVILDTSLYDAADGKLVYNAVTESFQPSSREEVVREVVDALTRDLQKRGLLPKPAGS